MMRADHLRGQIRRVAADRADRAAFLQREAVAAERNGGRDDLFERAGSPTAMDLEQAGKDEGHGDGRATYGFATNNKKIFLIVGIVNIAWIALRVFVIDGQVPLLAILLMILSVAGFIFMSKGEKDAKAQFDGDAGYAPPA